jgi:hypothetical protein
MKVSRCSIQCQNLFTAYQVKAARRLAAEEVLDTTVR